MKSQPTVTKKGLTQLSSALLLILLLSLFATGNAQARKPVPDPGPVVASDNLVRWGGDDPTPGIVEANYHLCSLTRAAVGMSSGTYTCNSSISRVFYDFAKFNCEVAHRRGDDWRCQSNGSQYYIDPDLEYSYSWNGDCTSNTGCDVTVLNRFTNSAVLGGPVTTIRLDPTLASLTLEGFGRIHNSTANPFDTVQSVTIDYMHLTFIGTSGNNKVLAVCKLTPLHDLYPVTFEITMAD